MDSEVAIGIEIEVIGVLGLPLYITIFVRMEILMPLDVVEYAARLCILLVGEEAEKELIDDVKEGVTAGESNVMDFNCWRAQRWCAG